ncbi:MAG: menaquinone biosynthesis protein [Acidobacteria bacterium]|nr:menaquinone biosynthesis protein [Acidobacteriota bacterium]
MARLRLSAISYLNTVPLMWDFERGPARDTFEIVYTVPSQCAQELAQGHADIGIIPAAAYATVSGLEILPGVAIAAKGPVRSILLVSDKPIDQIDRVALDSSSLSSVALARILFEKRWGGGRKFESCAPDLEAMLARHDAALLIGDRAIALDRSRYQTWDLAEEWVHFTGKPFVFAFWAVREQALKDTTLDLAAVFQESRDHGLAPENRRWISRVWAQKLGLTEAAIESYLTRNIHYIFDRECRQGLELFYRYAAELQLLPPVRELHFLSARPALT